MFKMKAGLLGLLAMLLIGLYASTAAYAVGPFFHKRAIGEAGNGVKWNQQKPPAWEAVGGEGGIATLVGKIGGREVTIQAKETKVKGIVYNNAVQGQAKIELTYVEPKLIKPTEAEGIKCTVTIGNNNVVKIFGHLAWTWDGTAAQLKEQPQTGQKPDWIFTPQELQQELKELPTGLIFTTITLKNVEAASCGTLASVQNPVKGNAAAAVELPNVKEWSTEETQKALPNETKQHLFNGKENVGVKTGLFLGTEPAKLEQEDKVKTLGLQGLEQQELAKFEE
jgi:hypothetical protein